MGYSGLSSVQDSDMASDLTSVATDALAKVLKKHLQDEEGNEFNTSGAVNVALFNESIIHPVRNMYGYGNEKLTKVLQRANRMLVKEMKQLQKSPAEDWSGGRRSGVENKRYHMNAYKRLLRKLDEVIDEMGG